MELNKNEEIFIDIIRAYDFLRKLSYTYESIDIFTPEPGVTFVNKNFHREILVCLGFTNKIEVHFKSTKGFFIVNKHPSFYLKDVYKKFGYYCLTATNFDVTYHKEIHLGAKFIQEYLMEVVKGEKWINDIYILT
jgi:hypothetical protein